MSARPRCVRLLAAVGVAPLLMVAVAAAAAAHGAPLNPVSRSAACGSDGSFTTTAVCRAARSGSEGQWFKQWDNVRVANVAGRDREIIPDGHLCSGGIADFGGLDLARADWPATPLRAGKAITVTYRGTIPHSGSFRMYVTKDGYNPKKALRWADLVTKPFLTATDPSFGGGAYTFRGTLPSGKVGRHILYTVWQNSGTPDTYYSCSDVVFAKPAAVANTKLTVAPKPSKKAASVNREPKKTATDAPSPSPSPTVEVTATSAHHPTPTVDLDLEAAEILSNPVDDDTSPRTAMMVVIGTLLLAGTGGGVVLARRRAARPA